MRKITLKGIEKHLGETRIRLDREGLDGNEKYWDHTFKPPIIKSCAFGVLLKDDFGFYIRMYKTYKNGEGTRVFDRYSFDDDKFIRLKNGDLISFSTGTYTILDFNLELQTH